LCVARAISDDYYEFLRKIAMEFKQYVMRIEEYKHEKMREELKEAHKTMTQ
jgi:hypothetical protein